MTSIIAPPRPPARADESPPPRRRRPALSVAAAVLLGAAAVGSAAAIPAVHDGHQDAQAVIVQDAATAVEDFRRAEDVALARAEDDVRREYADAAADAIATVTADAKTKTDALSGQAVQHRRAAPLKYGARIAKGEKDAAADRVAKVQCVGLLTAYADGADRAHKCETLHTKRLEQWKENAEYEARGQRNAENKKAAKLEAEAQQTTAAAKAETDRIDRQADADAAAEVAKRHDKIVAEFDELEAPAYAARDQKSAAVRAEFVVKVAGLAVAAAAFAFGGVVMLRRSGR